VKPDDLIFSVKTLKGTNLILSVGLRRAFSKVETYWVSIFRRYTKPHFWYVVRNWSYVSNGKLVESNTVPKPITEFSYALSQMDAHVEGKRNSKWVLNSINEHSLRSITAPDLAIWEKFRNGITLQLDEQSVAEPAETFESATKPKSICFSDLQRQRKRNAPW